MKIGFILLILLLALQSNAESICKDCKVTGMQPDQRRGGTYVWLTGNWNDSESNCNTPTTHAFFVPSDSTLEQSILSLSLAAMIANKTVGYAVGTGNCEQGYEILSHIYVSNDPT